MYLKNDHLKNNNSKNHNCNSIYLDSSSTTPCMDKAIIRDKALAMRKNLSKEFIKSNSNIIIDKLLSLEEFNNAKTIMSYVTINGEVDTTKLIHNILVEKQKKLLVPYVIGKDMFASSLNSYEDLAPGEFNILEPINKIPFEQNIDVVLVPGLGFDNQLARIGFGNGYFDRFLASRQNTIKIGISFDRFIFDSIPCAEYDILMDFIITEKQTLNINKH